MTARPYAHEWLRPPQGTDDIPRGTLVRDLDTGHVGILQDVTYLATEKSDPPPLLAFIRPVGGGGEWTTDPTRIIREPVQ